MENRTIESKALINDGGRILIPLNIRKALNLNIGDEMLLKVEEDEIHMIPLSKAVQQAQDLIRQYNKDGLKLTDVLAELRKEDQKND
ncbi:AbrB/MazE/SpoVT family DNA-binding domain-containing protein [Patescibacteria group bacterium]|nr:AbrB/MazE/SpoVT family DNA-binding domain-containing protein [Patescibacteria group bacterium]